MEPERSVECRVMVMLISLFAHIFLGPVIRNNMYCVVQLDERGGEGLAVVHQKWLTPLKKEVFWPPIKDSKLYRKALVDSEQIDVDTWALYGVQKIYFQTDDLNKAFRKEKEAEDTSDIYDTDDITNIGQQCPIRKRAQRFIDSDDSDVESKFCRPPQIKIKKLSGGIERRQISSPSTSQEQWSAAGPSEISTPQSQIGASLKSSRTPEITESNLTVFINILNTVKEQNKIILHKLDNVEKLISNSSVQLAGVAGNSGNPLSVELPLKSEENINEAEKLLQDKSNFNRLVNYLASLGGANLKNRVHKILRHVLTNNIACRYSYFGKKGKKIFSELSLNKAIIETTQFKIGSASLDEIEDTIKTWLKHAPDRKRGQKENNEVI